MSNSFMLLHLRQEKEKSIYILSCDYIAGASHVYTVQLKSVYSVELAKRCGFSSKNCFPKAISVSHKLHLFILHFLFL
jgi:hypothetical protein